jgi:hypothetical protein
MPKRNTTEDLILAWEALNKQKGAQTATNAAHPQAPLNFNKNNYTTQKLDIREISWDSIGIDLFDDSKWPEQINCNELDDKNSSENKTDKDALNKCKDAIEEYFNNQPKYTDEDSVFEKCAWYQSYHYGTSDWGMHFLEDCWLNIAKELSVISGTSKNDAIKSAFLMVFCHELFHHLTDNCATSMELIKQDPKLYIDYSSKVYKTDFKKTPDGALEEALANRFVYGRYEYCKINKHLLFGYLKRQPVGYNRFDDFKDQNFWKGRRELLNQILEVKSPAAYSLPLEQIYDHLDQSSYLGGNKMPIYIHYKKGNKQRIFIKNK